MIRGNKLSGFIERVDEDKRPITADIFLTEFCNNRCRYCRYSNDSGKWMRIEDFKLYVDRLLDIGVRSIVLTGGGEPTINPHFEKMCKYLEEVKIGYGINTNFNVMVFPKPVFLKVSLDSGNAEDYKGRRGKDSFGRVLRNIREYCEWKKINSKKTSVGVQCVTEDIKQVSEFYDSVKDLDVEYIQFRPIEKKGGYITNEAYKEILDYLQKLEDERIITSYKYSMMNYRPERCFGNWSVITVNVDGKVIYCCHRPDDVVGRLMDNDIIAKLKRYKVDMRKCDIPCRLSGANKFVEDYKPENDRYFV